jgi:RNA polymerase sigma factor (sigma-70 family)
MKRAAVGPPSARRDDSWTSDAELTQAAARGDVAAQREVVERALPVVRHTVRQLLGSSHHVEDAIQASLLAVLRSTPRFRGDCSLGTWATRIATRITLRLVHKERRLVPVDTMEELSTAAPDGRADGIARHVSEYLDRLPHPQRVAIVMRYGLDFTVDDIAEATEASPNTVKYRLKEALATVRRLVRQDLAVRGKRHDD